MDIVSGTLVKKDKSQAQASDVLAEAELIGFYFSAHWCGPCKAFTPVLAAAYEEMKKLNYKIEIIFASFDHNEESLFEYMNECHGDWYALPFGSKYIAELKARFKIEGIPSLIVVKKDGTVVTDEGDIEIESSGAEAYNEWIK